MMTKKSTSAWRKALSGGRRVRPPGRPGRMGTVGALRTPVGRHVTTTAPTGYLIDFSAKAIDPGWPPPWLDDRERRGHVVLIQWGLGCFERYLAGQGEQWLDAATRAADHLLCHQERGGRHAGGWPHRFPYKHTYAVAQPWLSGMAQGEGASLLVRIHGVTGDGRYADAAVRAIAPLGRNTAAGGAAALLGDGLFPEEYPTEPPSHVLNGGIFGLWGAHDVAAALGDSAARALWEEGKATLAANIDRYDTGRWSRYDLYPHLLTNIAHPAYHRLHINQLRAMALICDDSRFVEAADRFERYAARRRNVVAAVGRKVAFRLAVPRSPLAARLLPWSRSPTA